MLTQEKLNLHVCFAIHVEVQGICVHVFEVSNPLSQSVSSLAKCIGLETASLPGPILPSFTASWGGLVLGVRLTKGATH